MSQKANMPESQSRKYESNLRVGDWVEVRSAEEIMATLDGDHCVEALPFMPEMLKYCGRRFRISASAHKTADTMEIFSIRRLAHAVHLEDLRCDGQGHGGCQAVCQIFWKTCWLRRVSGEQTPAKDTVPSPRAAKLDGKAQAVWDALEKAAKFCEPGAKCERYRCQATEMVKATTGVRGRERLNPLFYVKDLTSGNVNLVDFIRFGTFAMVNACLLKWLGWRFPRVRGRAGDKTPSLDLNLQPGEWVRVVSQADVEVTLNRNRRNRGMWFDDEMAYYCGKGPFQVLRRVDSIINEKTGEMIKLPNPCIILDGVTCTGNYSSQRMFSRRKEYPFWREIWLERVSEPGKPRVAGQ
jgi:hypothetical protein